MLSDPHFCRASKSNECAGRHNFSTVKTPTNQIHCGILGCDAWFTYQIPTHVFDWYSSYYTAGRTPEIACVDYWHCKGVGEVVAASRRKKKEHDALEVAYVVWLNTGYNRSQHEN
jgi:hypothetical protein